MAFDSQDPKWTAYVLGELEQPDRAGVEQELEQSAEARRFVVQIRQTIDLVTTELQKEPKPALSVGQRDAVLRTSPASASAGNIIIRRRETGSRLRGLWTVAACLLIAAGLGLLMLPAVQSARRMSRLPSAKEAPPPANISSFPDSSQPTNHRELAYTVTKPVYGDRPDGTATDYLTDGTITNDRSAAPSNQMSHLAQIGNSGEPDSKGIAANNTVTYTGPGTVNINGTQNHGANTTLTVNSGTVNMNSDPGAIGAENLPVDTHRPVNRYKGLGTLNQDGGGQPNLSGGGPVIVDDLDVDDAPVIPFPDDHPIAFLDKRAWEELQRNRRPREDSTAVYEEVVDNPFFKTSDSPLSTFSIDVDTGSYSNVRRFLMQDRRLPPKAAVRIEEMLNYFHYKYPQPDGETPFSVTTEAAECPWNTAHRLVRIGLMGREMPRDKRPPSNLVFLVDVSGSMMPPERLPLVREALRLLVKQLTENDRVAIVVYAGNSGLALPSTTGDKQEKILAVLDQLEAGGSTNGGEGIQLAYEVALQNFVKKGTNRVILATDGDFNVGVTDRGELIKLIEEKAKSGVFLTTLGVGTDNLKDATLEQLADKGNGNYFYLDTLKEAQKVLVEQMSGTLFTIAKDVKIQIEFNPAQVAAFRLIGYENRILRHEDFNNDKKDAGDIGAGHTVTALYELVPAGKEAQERPAVDDLKYQKRVNLAPAADTGELLTLKLRYKQPDGETSALIETAVKDGGKRYGQATSDFQFAAAVALFGMHLRESPYKGNSSLDAVLELAQQGLGSDEGGYRGEFIELVKQAKTLMAK